jgi:hypothetical protein
VVWGVFLENIMKITKDYLRKLILEEISLTEEDMPSHILVVKMRQLIESSKSSGEEKIAMVELLYKIRDAFEMESVKKSR